MCGENCTRVFLFYFFFANGVREGKVFLLKKKLNLLVRWKLNCFKGGGQVCFFFCNCFAGLWFQLEKLLYSLYVIGDILLNGSIKICRSCNRYRGLKCLKSLPTSLIQIKQKPTTNQFKKKPLKTCSIKKILIN